MAFDRDGRHLASAGSDCKVVIWDTTAGGSYRLLHTLDTMGDNVVAFSPDGRRLGFADLVGGDNAVHLYDPATGEKVLALRGYSAWLRAVAFE